MPPLIRPLFSSKNIAAGLDKFLAHANWQIEQILFYAGEMGVKIARESGNYTDQTGNLRSSIGYVVSKDGRPLMASFTPADEGTDRKTGVNAGEKMAADLADEFSQGYVLVVMAGMDYAVYVEAMGKDVLTFSATKTQGFIGDKLKENGLLK